MSRRDRENLFKFYTTVKRAYKTAKQRGAFSTTKIKQYDKLIACPAVIQFHPHYRPIQVHRVWRRRVAQFYYRKTGRRSGLFGLDINWEEIYNWVLENIIPIIKLLLFIVPFII